MLLNFRPEYRAPWIGRTHYQQIALRPLDAAAAGTAARRLARHRSVARALRRTRLREHRRQPLLHGGGGAGADRVGRARRRARPLPARPARSRASRCRRACRACWRRASTVSTTRRKGLLQTAAVIGDEVPEALLERVAGLDRDALRGALRQLVQSEFLYEASLYPESEYAFKHPLTREVAYASLLRERRQALHAAVATGARSARGRYGRAARSPARAPLGAGGQAARSRALARARGHATGSDAGEAVFHWRKVTELLADEGESAGGARAARSGACPAGLRRVAQRRALWRTEWRRWPRRFARWATPTRPRSPGRSASTPSCATVSARPGKRASSSRGPSRWHAASATPRSSRRSCSTTASFMRRPSTRTRTSAASPSWIVSVRGRHRSARASSVSVRGSWPSTCRGTGLVRLGRGADADAHVGRGPPPPGREPQPARERVLPLRRGAPSGAARRCGGRARARPTGARVGARGSRIW